MSINAVAPLAGAWIEIGKYGDLSERPTSLPSRERGLKFFTVCFITIFRHVAPLAGAWIEIYREPFIDPETGRSPRGSVD